MKDLGKDFMLWVFLMVLYLAGIETGVTLMTPGGGASFAVQFVFTTVILAIVVLSRRAQPPQPPAGSE